MSSVNAPASQTRVSHVTLTVSRKLPDDLSLVEYSEIVGAVETMTFASGVVSRMAPPSTHVLRSRYGSDFLIIVSVAGAALGGLVAISKVVKNFAASMEHLANSRKVNREARLLDLDVEARTQAAKAAVQDGDYRETVSAILRDELDGMASFRQRRYRILGEADDMNAPSQVEAEETVEDLVRASIILAMYDLSITIERNE